MNYILNEPYGCDGFWLDGKDGSAFRVANQIIDVLGVEEHEGQKSRPKLKRLDGESLDYPISLIGLNGSWGSGKSNVLEIVKKDDELSKNCIFFEYDFWGHRQDLTRKMFLGCCS